VEDSRQRHHRTGFELDDGTGQIRVEPDVETTIKFEDELEDQFRIEAREETPGAVADFVEQYSSASAQDKSGVTGFLFSKERRYTTRWVPIGATLYLLGGTHPAGTDGGTRDERVFRQDESSGEFIVSAKPVEDLLGNAMRVAVAKGVGGLAVSAGGLYLFLTWLL